MVPVVLVPATMPLPEALPSDLAWICELNAFMMPEPPEHRAHLVQLVDLVGDAVAAAHEAPAPIFSVPSNGQMLRRGHGNIPFTETSVDKEMRLCSVGGSSRVVWLASNTTVEVRDFASGSLRNSDRLGAEWLQATTSSALAAKSGNGYQAPDTISFDRLSVIDNAIARTTVCVTWSWQFPPIALSKDEARLLAFVHEPERRDVILFSVKDRKEIGACPFRDSYVVSICFDPAGKRYFALATQGDRMVLSAVDATACSVQW